MKQKLESVIKKVKILALASLTSLAINCQYQNIGTGVEVSPIEEEKTYNSHISDCDCSSIFPCGVRWRSSDGYGGTCSGIGTWCPPGEFCHEDPNNPGTFKCYPDIIMNKVSD